MSVIVTETYNVPVEQVWKAITDKDEMKIWYFDIPNFVLKEGAVFDFFEPGDEKKYLHRCQVLGFEPNRFLKHTWTHPDHSRGSSELLWELEKTDNGTKLTLTHTGLDSFSDAGADFAKENYKTGWNEILGKSLKNFLENNGDKV
ncbi:SRPBCC family protein [Elizabethkingia miricola]|uniref:SRPBCC family protein n=1 Tax=Elizabethkingia miricola TaxID=172045 RepID=UPI0025975DA6|nr:SRPBCC domain-containing protein [uncultured Elizabethkingia sp.]